MRVLVAGAGDVGLAAAGYLLAGGAEVTALRRSVNTSDDALQWIAADLGRPISLPVEPDVVIFCASPDRRDEAGYRRVYIDGVNHLFDALNPMPASPWPGRFILVSSTAVYAQDRGEWVDETSAASPRRFNGRILLQAERVAAERCPGAIAVRAGGIYGPGRMRLIRMVREGGLTVQADPPQFTNRIHRDDLAAFLAYLAGLQQPHPVYCAVDDGPAPRHEVLAWLARRIGAPAPVIRNTDAGQGKRVSNRRLSRSGFRLQYTDYRAGYRQICPAPPTGLDSALTGHGGTECE